MEKLDDFCEGLEARIRDAYQKSGNRCGWRLLASPRRVMKGADVAFIGLNPAGEAPANSAIFDTKDGNAYVVESWGKPPGEAPLQKQVRALFERLDVAPENVLAGNFIPFHAPSWNKLQNHDFAIRFGEKLWRDILHRAKPRLVIGMGGVVFSSLCRVLDVEIPQSVSINWKGIDGKRVRFDGDGLLVGLPHLSRFKVITRPQSAAGLRDLFQEHWRG